MTVSALVTLPAQPAPRAAVEFSLSEQFEAPRVTVYPAAFDAVGL